MSVKRGTVTAMDGHVLSTFIYEVSKPVGHIHLIHGMAEHIARYEELAAFLAGQGYFVSGHDQRGHGETQNLNGKLGFLAEQEGFERVTKDTYEVISSIRKEYMLDSDLIVMGHSMGSFVVRRYIQLYGENVKKAILMGTGGNPGLLGRVGLAVAAVNRRLKGAAEPDKIMNFLTFGSYNSKFKEVLTPFDWLSTDRAEVEKYIQDPYCGFVASNRFFHDLITGLVKIHRPEEVKKTPKQLPILLISGEVDPVGKMGKDVFKVAEQYRKYGMEQVDVILFENKRHELLHETNKMEVFESILQWIRK